MTRDSNLFTARNNLDFASVTSLSRSFIALQPCALQFVESDAGIKAVSIEFDEFLKNTRPNNPTTYTGRGA